jgi:hypothetical protein
MSARLTGSSVHRIRPAERTVVDYDSLVPGLFVRISPRAVRSWGFASRL